MFVGEYVCLEEYELSVFECEFFFGIVLIVFDELDCVVCYEFVVCFVKIDWIIFEFVDCFVQEDYVLLELVIEFLFVISVDVLMEIVKVGGNDKWLLVVCWFDLMMDIIDMFIVWSVWLVVYVLLDNFDVLFLVKGVLVLLIFVNIEVEVLVGIVK